MYVNEIRYPNALPHSVTEDQHTLWSERFDSPTQYVVAAQHLTSHRWTPVLQKTGERSSIVWVIQRDGQPVKTLPPLTREQFHNPEMDVCPPDEGLLYCIPLKSNAAEAHLSTHAEYLGYGTSTHMSTVRFITQLLNDEQARNKWLHKMMKNGKLEHDTVTVMLRSAPYPDYIGFTVLTDPTLPIWTVESVVKTGSNELISVALAYLAKPSDDSRKRTSRPFTRLAHLMHEYGVIVPWELILWQAAKRAGKQTISEGVLASSDVFLADLINPYPSWGNESTQDLIRTITKTLPATDPDHVITHRVLADHPFTPSTYLSDLAFHSDYRVRALVAENPFTPSRPKLLASIQH